MPDASLEQTPQVSVVIPCYNGESFVGEAIESVLAQTAGTPEVVVVDDGSADGSVGVVERYTAGGRVRLFRHEANRGIAAARNTGVQNSRARFVGFLDQDDVWMEDLLETLLAVYAREEDAEPGVVFGDTEVVDVETNERYPKRNRPPADIGRFGADELLVRLFSGNFMAIGTSLIRKERLVEVGMFDEGIRGGSDDFDLFVRLAQKHRFEYVDKPVAVRRVHGRNYTDAERMVPDALRILERTVAERPGLAHVVPRARSFQYFRLARELHAKGEHRRAIGAYAESIRARPANLRSFLGLSLCCLGPVGDSLLGIFYKLCPRAPRR